MKVIVAGEMPFLEDVTTLCFEAGHETYAYLIEDFYDAIESGQVIENAADVDVVIELHNESLAAKQELLLALSELVPYRAIILGSALASSATQIASWVPSPQRVVGFGLLSPLGEKKVVEISRALQTSDAAWSKAADFWESLGSETVAVADGPGLVRARVVCCLINEAADTLHNGVASPSDIDMAMKLGTSYPLGPFEWADHLGLDFVLGVMSGLFAEWGDDRYRPSPLLKRMVLAGYLGKKSGRGFYEYGE